MTWEEKRDILLTKRGAAEIRGGHAVRISHILCLPAQELVDFDLYWRGYRGLVFLAPDGALENYKGEDITERIPTSRRPHIKVVTDGEGHYPHYYADALSALKEEEWNTFGNFYAINSIVSGRWDHNVVTVYVRPERIGLAIGRAGERIKPFAAFCRRMGVTVRLDTKK